MCATPVLDLTDDRGVVRCHYHDLVDDQREEVLKCEVNRQQFQVVDVKRPLQGGPRAGSPVRCQMSPPSLGGSVVEELELRMGGPRRPLKQVDG